MCIIVFIVVLLVIWLRVFYNLKKLFYLYVYIYYIVCVVKDWIIF